MSLILTYIISFLGVLFIPMALTLLRRISNLTEIIKTKDIIIANKELIISDYKKELLDLYTRINKKFADHERRQRKRKG